MGFLTKGWENIPSEDTPIDAAALVDLEVRTTGYAEAQVFTASTSGGSGVLDFSIPGKRPNAIWIITVNMAAKLFPLAGALAGQAVTAVVKQDGTGNWPVTWQSTLLWEGGVVPPSSLAANSIDLFSFFSDGVNFYGMPVGLGFAVAP